MLLKRKTVLIRLFLFSSLVLVLFPARAQVVINNPLNETISIRSRASLFIAGKQQYSFDYVYDHISQLPFRPLTDIKENYGFSEDHLWIQFNVKNNTNTSLNYYLETGRPITDNVDLFLVKSNGKVEVQHSGDVIPFDQKSVLHRKSVFNITIKPHESLNAFVHLKSDGEVMMLPLKLHPQGKFMEETYQEQIFYGFFYGILLLACVVYLFFYFALRDTTFIYYGLYVLFIAMLQFSLDGFFHQYITPQGGWISNRAVLASALISLLFFGKYGERFLAIKKHSSFLHLLFKGMCVVIIISLLGLLFVPKFLSICYPLANAIGLLVLLQVIASVVFMKRKKLPVDNYFIVGIFFLIMGFVVFILNNFNTIGNSFLTNNGAKFGIGLEIIFLSISMSNRIRALRMENEKNQLLALQRAKDMNDIKSSFLSNISHELRTPLNMIMGVATSLRENKQEENLEEKCKLLLNSSESLLGYIEDILDFTVIEKGNHELKEVAFNLHTILNKIIETNKRKAQGKGLKFSHSAMEVLPKHLIGDKGKLVQILNNLLDNAIKFTESGWVELQVGYRLRKGNKVALSFSVSDSGIGISKEKMSTIYESFTKKSFLDKREFSGLGLGLYIVKTYVDLQQGTISIENGPQHGILCKVDLDFYVDEQELHGNKICEKTKEYDLGHCHILLAEDNIMNQTVIKLLIKKWKNATLTIANNGEEALALLKNNKFDVVLMDLQMPVMDGFEATAMIRSGKVGNTVKHIPIIAITADSTNNTRKEVLRLGVTDYMTKPVDGGLLFHKIKKNMVAVK